MGLAWMALATEGLPTPGDTSGGFPDSALVCSGEGLQDVRGLRPPQEVGGGGGEDEGGARPSAAAGRGASRRHPLASTMTQLMPFQCKAGFFSFETGVSLRLC